jgi:hypothetical protein
MHITSSDELSHPVSLLIRKPPARQADLLTHKAHECAAVIHRLAAVAHAAAAAAHSRGDYASAAELSKQACAHSMQAGQQAESPEILPSVAGMRAQS